MKQMELEVKVLNIDEKNIINKIIENGGKLKDEYFQYLYSYDMPTIYGRYLDIMLLINQSENKLRSETALERLKLLIFEIDNLMSINQKQELKKIIGKSNFSEITEKENIIEIFNKPEISKFLSQFGNNSKKWIRVRKTKNTTMITVKHILANNESNLQQVLETEMEVPNMEEANQLLQALGFSYRSYQEKKRKTFELDGHEIDIDTWPWIPTYIEIEGKDENDLEKILQKLGYSIKDTISCTADEIYKIYGINVLEKREVKF